MSETEKVARSGILAGLSPKEAEFVAEVIEIFDAVVVGSEEEGTGQKAETSETQPASDAGESDGAEEERRSEPTLRSSLDSNKRNRNRGCGGMAAMGQVPGAEAPKYGYTRINCKSWDCGYCGPKKAAEVTWRIATAAREHGLSRFLTLTLDPQKVGEGEDLVAYIRQVWRKFRVYLKRRHGHTVEFISVIEAHKSGVPHMHVLVDRYIPQAWISDAWNRLGGGRIVFIEKVADLSKVGWYLGKYLTKDMMLSAGKRVRRYSASRGVKIMPKRGGNGWIRAPGGVDELREFAGDRAEDVAEDETGRLKYFATDRPIKRLKALGDRLIMGSKSRAADGSDGNKSFSGVEKGEGVVPARGAQVDGGEGRGREEDGNEGEQRDGGSIREASDSA